MQTSINIKKAKMRLLALFILGMAPFGLACLLFYTPLVNTVSVHSEGKLLETPLKVGDFTDTPPKWELWYIGDAVCDKVCQTRVEALERLQLALGKDQDRLRIRVVPHHPDRDFLKTGMLAIVDPRQYLILAYEASQTEKAILKDLQRLLKYARIG